MSTTNLPAQKKQTIKSLLTAEGVKNRFNELLGKKAAGFITSVLQTVNNNKLLATAEPQTILTAAATAALLDLPINSNLGFAYIIPYNENFKDENGQWQKRCVAQFQLGYKGLIQLAQRSGQYSKINAVVVYENQFQSWDELSETLNADFSVNGAGNVAGYVAYFKLTNGFEKTVYWSYEKIHKHASKYSKSYGNKKGLWQDQDGGADAMGVKTVLKHALSKYGPLEIESQMSKAIQADHSVQVEEGKHEYPDSTIEAPKTGVTKSVEDVTFEKEKARIIEHIEKSETTTHLFQVDDIVDDYGLRTEYNDRYDELDNSAKKSK